MRTVRLAILGFGQRGMIYAAYAKQHAEEFVVTAITDIDPQKREIAAREYGCPVFDSYEKMLSSGVDADIIAVATQDCDHPEHTVACMEKGYDVLLEKPIANTLEGCAKIESTAKKYGRKAIVCHVLRFTPFYSAVKDVIDAGELGDIVTVSTSENVGYYHQAHSFVRGPWRNSGSSSPMILAKCCHDMDLLRWLIGKKCEKAASFGNLTYFRPRGLCEILFAVPADGLHLQGAEDLSGIPLDGKVFLQRRRRRCRPKSLAGFAV